MNNTTPTTQTESREALDALTARFTKAIFRGVAEARPVLRDADGANERANALYDLFRLVVGYHAADSVKRIIDATGMYDATFRAEAVDIIGTIIDAWHKAESLPVDMSSHTLARAYVYTAHAERSLEEQTPLIEDALRKLNALT